MSERSGEGGGRRGAEVLESRRIYSGRAVELVVDRVILPNGRQAEMEVVRHAGSAAVLPIAGPGEGGADATGEGAGEEVVLLRQYRYSAGAWVLEIPAGKLDGDEPPEECARRELEEETGLVAGSLEPLGWIWTTPGTTDERIWLYAARGLAAGRQRLEADEVVEVERLPLAEAVDRAVHGEIQDAKTVCALLRVAARGEPSGDGRRTGAEVPDQRAARRADDVQAGER